MRRALLLYLSYFSLRIFLFPFRFLPGPFLHGFANAIAHIAFYCFPKIRKRLFSNLALATKLQLSHEERKVISIKSLKSLILTVLEFSKMDQKKNVLQGEEALFTIENTGPLISQNKKKKGLIIFAGHQGNWEMALLKISQEYPCVCIVKEQKNPHINRWITHVRSKYNAELMDSRLVLKKCLTALNEGKFVIICGDQATTQSPYHENFLGRSLYRTTLPALLAYKTNSPIVVAAISRDGYKNKGVLSNPIVPNPSLPKQAEISRMMGELFSSFEASIVQKPEDWFWLQNLWKQEVVQFAYKNFKYESILIVLPENEQIPLQDQLDLIGFFRKIYRRSFIDVFASKAFIDLCKANVSLIPYQTVADLLVQDDRYKLLFNFSDHKINRHFLKQSVLGAFSKADLVRFAKKRGLSRETKDLKEILKYAIVQPEYFSRLNQSDELAPIEKPPEKEFATTSY